MGGDNMYDVELANGLNGITAIFTDNKSEIIWFIVGVFSTLIIITLILGAAKLVRNYSRGFYRDIQGTRYKTKAERDYANSIW